MMARGWFRGKTRDDETWNGSGRIFGSSLSLWGFKKWLSSKNSGSLYEDLKAQWNGDGG